MKRIEIVIVLCIVLFSCGDGSSKFIGHWKSEDTKSRLTISRTGKLFTLEYYAPDGIHNIVKGGYENGILKFNGTFVTYSDEKIIIEGKKYYKWAQ